MDSTKGKVTANALVRNSEGKPQFTDINNIPEVFWDLLTEAEKEEIRNDRITLSGNT